MDVDRSSGQMLPVPKDPRPGWIVELIGFNSNFNFSIRRGRPSRRIFGDSKFKYAGLDSSTQIDVTINGGRLKFVMRLIARFWSIVFNGQKHAWGQMTPVPKDPRPGWIVELIELKLYTYRTPQSNWLMKVFNSVF
jgi:hypothetical protein